MKICPVCQTQNDDAAAFCSKCGYGFNGQPVPQPMVYTDPKDHTAEFDPRDISDNKVIAMLLYLSSFLGIIIAALTSNQSPYVAFHMRQALKFMVAGSLLGILAVALCFTIIVPIACGIGYVVLFVCKIICFFQICSGKAKEAPIVSGLSFMK